MKNMINEKSSMKECVLLEREKGKWYYILEKENSPQSAWNWMDYANVFGPYNSAEEIIKTIKGSDIDSLYMIPYDHYCAMSQTQREPYEDLLNCLLM